MTRKQNRIVGNLGQLLRKAFIQRQWIASGKIGATATLKKQRVTRNQCSVEHEALAARGVPWGVNEFNRNVASHHNIAAAVRNEIGIGEVRDLANVFGFFGLHMNRHRNDVEQFVHAFDGVTHHLSTNVIGVIVGCEHTGDFHVVGGEHIDNALHVVGRVDSHGLAGLAIADEVDEVHHLAGERIGRRDVATGKQLAEIEAISCGGISHRDSLAEGRRNGHTPLITFGGIDMTNTDKVHEPLTDLFMGFTLDTDDPFPIYAQLREQNPVAWNATQGFWVASRHADCMAVSTAPDTFRSAKGILTFEIGADYATPPTMMHTDPPDHTRYRNLVQPAFGRKVVRTLENSVHAAAKTLVDALPLNKPFEIVAPLAVPLPVQVIAQLLGLPESEWDKVWDWSEASIPGTEIFNNEELKNRLNGEMMAELMRLVATSRTEPREDVISMLSSVEIDGDRLTDDEIAMFLNQILVAGNETTRNTISGGLVALAENPDQWARLVADRSLVASIYFMRTAAVDTVLGGQQISAGDAVVMVYASANRDEAEFGPTADQFDVGRSPNHQIAFGFGAHFCLGAALARLEVAAVLEHLLDRGVTRLELLSPAGMSASNVIAGVNRAEVILHTN
jgi:cytochrome P450